MAKFGPVVFASLGLVFLDLLAWIVLAAGASALQHNATLLAAVLGTNSQLSLLAKTPLTYGDIMPLNSPSRFISYEWFKAVFQVVTLLLAAGSLVTGQLYRCRAALVGLFAALGVFFADSCQTFFYIHGQAKAAHALGLVPSNINSEITTWFAGCIMTAALNFALVIALGIDNESRRPTYDEPRSTGYGEPRGNGAGGTTASDVHKTAV